MPIKAPLAVLLLLALGFGAGVLLGNMPNNRATEEPAPYSDQRGIYPDRSEPEPTLASTPEPVVITPTPAPVTQGVQVHLTYYTCQPFCLGDPMANTQPLHESAVACGYAFNLGQRFRFEGEEYVCEDRGGGSTYWVDFWKPNDATGRAWQARVGVSGTVQLLR